LVLVSLPNSTFCSANTFANITINPMTSQALTTGYHERLHLPDYDKKLADVEIDDLGSAASSDSPSQVWAREWLRAELDLSAVDKVPVDLLVWGRGEPKHPAGTKIGGRPVWPSGRALPLEERNDWETRTPLRFFGQINFMDSTDILPALPGDILSIWVSQGFPYEEDAIQIIWINADEVKLADEYEHPFPWPEMPSIPFYAVLHRSWDRSRRQQLLDEGESREQNDLMPCEESWMASKIGGRPTQFQSEDAPLGSFFLQIKSIEPANTFPHPWVNVEEPFETIFPKNEYHHEKNQFSIGDGGLLYFYLTSWGTVDIVFDTC
jgi:uncharacterized protein YwqG